MAIPYTFVPGTVIRSAEVNTNFKVSHNYMDTFYISPATDIINGLVAHSDTTLSLAGSTGAIFQSVDSGVTWTSKNTMLDTKPFIKLCKANPVYAVALDSSATSGSVHTSDSGATWSGAGTTGFMTNTRDVSYPIVGLIVVAGNDNVAGIQYSTDNAVTWTDATTGPTYCVAVDMYSGTTGFAIDNSGNIYKSVDSGVNWTDTTHNISTTLYLNGVTSLCAVSNSKFVAIVGVETTGGELNIYDSTGNTTVKTGGFFPGRTVNSGGIGITTTGKVYGLMAQQADPFDSPFVLLTSDSTLTTWSYQSVGFKNWSMAYATNGGTDKNDLSIGGNGKVYVTCVGKQSVYILESD